MSEIVELREASVSQQETRQRADAVQAVSAAMAEALKAQPALARELATLFSPILVGTADFGLAWPQCAAILKVSEEDLAALWRRVLDDTASRVDPKLLTRLREAGSARARADENHGQTGSRRWQPVATYSARGNGTSLRASDVRLSSLVQQLRPGARASALRRIHADAQRLVEDFGSSVVGDVRGPWALTASIWPDTEVVWRWRLGSGDRGAPADESLAQAHRVLRDAVLPALDRGLGLRT